MASSRLAASLCSDPKPQTSGFEFLEAHPFVKATLQDKIYGSIVGSALGDTIGLYTEFLSKTFSEKVYPQRRFSLVQPVTELYSDMHRDKFEACAWTDDTDHALLILLSYLYDRSTKDLAKSFAHRLHIWIDHGLLALGRPPCGIGRLIGGTVKSPKYLTDPVAAATKQWITSGREAAPNGSLMRTHPIGILAVGMSEDEARQLSTEVGMTTHVDPRCTVSSAVAVTVIRGILRGEIVNEDTLDDAIERGYNWIFSAPNSFDLLYPGSDPDTPREQLSNSLDPEEFFRYVYAKGYDDLQLDDRSSIGYVFKCLGAGMYVLRLGMRSTDPQALPPGELFETLMTDLVMQSGDADTNATVAGALLGAWLGYTSLPARWAGGLKYREWLIQKARRAITLLGITEGELEPEDDEKPDGGKGLMSEAELAVRDREFVAMMLQKDHDRRERERKKKTADSHSGRGSWFWRTVGYSH